MTPSPGLAGHQQRHMRPIDLYRSTDVTQPHGGYDRNWSFVAEVSASIAPATAAERQVASQEGNDVTHAIKAPRTSGLQRGDRLVTVDGQSIEITHVDTTSTRRPVLHALGSIEPWDEPTA